MQEMCIALLIALTKLYDNYKTPLGSNVKCFKSRYCPNDQVWKEDKFIVWMEISEINTTIVRIGWLVDDVIWHKFNIMIVYNDVPNGIITEFGRVERELIRL